MKVQKISGCANKTGCYSVTFGAQKKCTLQSNDKQEITKSALNVLYSYLQQLKSVQKALNP